MNRVSKVDRGARSLRAWWGEKTRGQEGVGWEGKIAQEGMGREGKRVRKMEGKRTAPVILSSVSPPS